MLLASPAGCGEDEPAPVVAARAFARAARGDSTDDLLPLIERRALARLEQAATRASDQVGGRRSIDPTEMLQVVDLPSRFQVASAELVSSDDLHAEVVLTAADNTRYTIHLVFEDDAWRVTVPVPPEPPSGTP